MQSFLYLLQAGKYALQTGFTISRISLNSSLLFSIENGSLCLTLNRERRKAGKGDFCLVDCSNTHECQIATGATVIWLHFAGIGAREYYRCFTSYD